MPRQYLDVPYRSKDAAKALGARFDGSVKRWYVDPGVDLAAFSLWLPADLVPSVSAVTTPAAQNAALSLGASTEVASGQKGVTLSHLLNGVAAAVSQAFEGGIWTLVEVSEATVRNGHVYLDLSERDRAGQLLAKARATIWASTALRILPEFERATGAVVGAGIKLLVRARPVFKSQYGFSLDIDAIDAGYTLGDLEARKKEIRSRLQQEGVFGRNRALAAPWDFRLVLVVAPQEAAGLGDFQKEAERLSRFGLCRFVYAHSRFQGPGAASDIVAAAASALTALGADPDEGGRRDGSLGADSNGRQPGVGGHRLDAIVFIRGGGAVNDLAWLNDYELARFICDQAIPVLTGIGHERDSTLPDEVANLRFDTPSKVIAGIEQQIMRRAREARDAWEIVAGQGTRTTRSVRLRLEREEAAIRSDARDHVARARRGGDEAFNTVRVGAVQQIHRAARAAVALLHDVRGGAARDIAAADHRVPALLRYIQTDAQNALGIARAATRAQRDSALDRSAALARAAQQAVETRVQRVAERASVRVQQQRQDAQSLMREIAGQGPEKTLARGFAIVKTETGQPVTSNAQASDSPSLHIQFRDGSTVVRPDPTSPRKR